MSAPGTGQAGHRTAGPDTAARPATLRHLARHQVMGLASVFLLGMAVNLIGLPDETSGVAHLASIAFLAAHGLIALGLVIGAVLLLRAAAGWGSRARSLVIADAAAIALAVAAGILTLITKSGWWSYAMAAGFIAALLTSGSLLRAESTPAHSAPRAAAPGQHPHEHGQP